MLHRIRLLSLFLLAGTSAQAGRVADSPDSPYSLLPVPLLRAPPKAPGAQAPPGGVPSMLPEDRPHWLQQRGTSGIDQGTDIAVSCEGTYSVGYTTGNFSGTASAVLGNDWFLIKHNLAGTLEWTRQHGGLATGTVPSPNDFAESIATFDVGGRCDDPVIYVAGYSNGNLDGNAPLGDYDAFLTKYDKKGTRLWTRMFGTPLADRGVSVATDRLGNVYVAGFSNTTNAGTDAFLVKYNDTGTQQWKQTFASSNNQHDQARGVATDANGDIYVGGHTFGSLGGPHQGVSDIFFVKLAPSGTITWTQQLGTPVADVVEDLATSRRLTGEVDLYLAGHTLGSYARPNPTSDYDALLLKLRPDGTVQWSKQFGTPGRDMLFGVTSDGGGTVYVTGTSTYDIKQPNTPLDTTDPFETDVFVMSFDANGASLKARQIGSTNAADTTYEQDIGGGIAADTGAGVYVTGYTEAHFPALPTTTAGGTDLIVFKYLDGCTVTTPNQCKLSYGWGDPHYVTFDGYAYDFQGHGEFILAESTVGDLIVQVRQVPWNGSSQVSVFTAAAVKLGTDRVAYYLGASPPLKVNGISTSITQATQLRGGGRILPKGGGYVLEWPTGDHLTLTPVSSYLNIDLLLAPSRRGKVRGPLGNFNGNREDDFTLRNGTPLNAPPSFAQMYTGPNSFVNSWRISRAESLFDYAPGASTDSFTLLDFPTAPPVLSSSQRQQAQQVCQGAGVTEIAALWACITDVGLTQDSSFASTAATVQTSAQAQGATPPPEPAPQSAYLTSFDSAAPGAEWSSSLRSTSPTGEHTFLGTFGNETVRFEVQALPPHTKVTLSFDLYVINGWDGVGPFGPSRFFVTGNGLPVLLDTTFSNTSSSQNYPNTAPGQHRPGTGASQRNTLRYPFGDSVYRLQYTFSHTASSVSFFFGASGLSGINDEAWGLDNVELRLQ
ncbi:SBBP repeat-containing protein [Myxococcus fulvus]|uniref:SBBP repeat-containing protein n=1 Tax=Myxococcus fulvus TaxID=33 RepID=UPI003B99BA2E